jgi:hypothetical protein
MTIGPLAPSIWNGPYCDKCCNIDNLRVSGQIGGSIALARLGRFRMSPQTKTIFKQIVDSFASTSLGIKWGSLQGQAKGGVAVLMLGIVLILLLMR